MNKSHDLVSVSVSTALQVVQGPEKRYELLESVGEYLKDIVLVTHVTKADFERLRSRLIDPCFEDLLSGTYENFYLASRCVADMKFEDPLSPAPDITIDRAARALRSIPNSQVVKFLNSRVWEYDELMSDTFVGLWMEYFVRLLAVVGCPVHGKAGRAIGLNR